MAIDDSNRVVNLLSVVGQVAWSAALKGSGLERQIDSRGRIIIEDEKEITYISLCWDRIDETFYVDVEKEPNGDYPWDETNTYDQKKHRVFPPFVSGAPTVAAQLQKVRESFRPTEISTTNGITPEFVDLNTLTVTFDAPVISVSLLPRYARLVKDDTGDIIPATEITYDDLKVTDVTINFFSNADYSTTYTLYLDRVMNLDKQIFSFTASVTTGSAPPACGLITGITFEAYGSGAQTLTPLSAASYAATHSNNQFIYYQSALSWEEFNNLEENLFYPISIPDGITHPSSVIAYYKEGSFLLNDSAWIVAVVGSEDVYSAEYVLYSLDELLGYKQLTPAGSTTTSCGTTNWGGDWGLDSIQQFAITRA